VAVDAKSGKRLNLGRRWDGVHRRRLEWLPTESLADGLIAYGLP
jgi:hypothetical protein